MRRFIGDVAQGNLCIFGEKDLFIESHECNWIREIGLAMMASPSGSVFQKEFLNVMLWEETKVKRFDFVF